MEKEWGTLQGVVVAVAWWLWPLGSPVDKEGWTESQWITNIGGSLWVAKVGGSLWIRKVGIPVDNQGWGVPVDKEG